MAYHISLMWVDVLGVTSIFFVLLHGVPGHCLDTQTHYNGTSSLVLIQPVGGIKDKSNKGGRATKEGDLLKDHDHILDMVVFHREGCLVGSPK